MAGPVRVKFTKERRKVGKSHVVMHIARCQEDGHTTTGETQAEAARDFAPHMHNQHPGRTIEKV